MKPANHDKAKYRHWVTIVKTLALKVPKGARPAPFWLALRQAVANGLIPPAAHAIPVVTLYRVAREMGVYPVFFSRG